MGNMGTFFDIRVFLVLLSLISCVYSQPRPPTFNPPGGFAPGPSGGFPGQQGGFPGQQSGFPGQQAGFPGSPLGGVGGNIRPQPFGFGGNTGGLNAFSNLGGAGFGANQGFGTNPGLGAGFGATPNLGVGANPGFGVNPGFGTTPGLGAGFGATPGFAGLGANQFGNAAAFNPALSQVAGAGFTNARAPPTTLPYQYPAVGGLQGQPINAGGALGGGTNALASLFQGQNVGAGMSVDQMRQLDTALFGGNVGAFQTEQPTTTFNYPMSSQAAHPSSIPSTTFTTQQFAPSPMGPGNPLGPANPMMNNVIGGAFNPYGIGQQQQQQTNPAYSSLTSGFNNLLTGVGAGLANAGRDIANGYAPPSLTTNPSTSAGTGYLQNPTTPLTSTTPISTSTNQQYATRSYPTGQPTMNPTYGASPQQTLTATYPGLGTVNLGVPAVGGTSNIESLRSIPPTSNERAPMMQTSSMQTKRLQEVA